MATTGPRTTTGLVRARATRLAPGRRTARRTTLTKRHGTDDRANQFAMHIPRDSSYQGGSTAVKTVAPKPPAREEGGARAAASEFAGKARSSCLVVGAGPAGLAAAIMLAQEGWRSVRVVEKRAPPVAPSDPSYTSNPDRSYNLGVSGRGQRVLGDIGVLDEVRKYAAVNRGRQTWDAKGDEKITLRNQESYQASLSLTPPPSLRPG